MHVIISGVRISPVVPCYVATSA